MTSGEHFGRLLRKWRVQNQVTQLQVAEMLGWDKPQVSRLELGRRQSLTVEEALQLCALMGVPMTEATEPVAVPTIQALEADWLGHRVARDTNTPASVVRVAAQRLYGHDASTEHAIRCAYVDGDGGHSFGVSVGNHTRAIIRELLDGVAVAS